jgi:hypothetical protein
MPPKPTREQEIARTTNEANAIKAKVDALPKTGVQPTVSATELVNPAPKVNPPAPVVNTNDGTRTGGLIDNVANNTQEFIRSTSENAAKEQELAQLLGNQTFDAAGQRTKLGEQYGLPENVTRLTDIQTQLAKANTASNVQKTQIAGAAGQTLGQGQRELTQQDRENAVRNAGLAAEAAVLQGSIETASTLINSAMQDYYSDRQLTNQNMIQQLEYYGGLADDETAQLLEKEKRVYEEDQLNIQRAQTMVDGAVSSGYLSGKELQDVLAIKDPAAQAEMAQIIIAREIQKEIAEAKAAAAGAGIDSPETKNFGTTDAPIWKQWNSTTGSWEDVTGITGASGSPEEIQQTLDQLSFLRDTTARILGGEDIEGNKYDALYKASGPSGAAKFLGDTFVGDTDYRRLETLTDTLRTNVLALMTDPAVKKFFGPQMSNADVKLMSATGSTLRPESQSPEDMKAEAQRLDDLLNRMQTAVKQGQSGLPNNVQGPVQPVNVITAPDGLQIEIID